MPRFVILEHAWPSLHWDLLLEAGPVLKAWRLLNEPMAGTIVPAEANIDHRLMYLDYEGPLSGDRGSVSQWDVGTFDGELQVDGWRLMMNGRRFAGLAVMSIVEGRWVFQCPDASTERR